MAAATALANDWLDRLGTVEGLGLAGELNRFPELRDAVAPPGFKVIPSEDSYLAREAGAEVAVELRARLDPPADVGTDEPGYVDLALTTDATYEENKILVSTLDMPSALHGQGLGRLVIGQLAVLGDRLGLEAIELEAGKVGRWAWMRCGFDFADRAEREKVINAAEDFAQRLGRKVDLSKIEHSWGFLDLREPVSPDQMRAASGPLIDVPVTLGKALLLGPNVNTNPWFGRLTLDRKSEGRVRLDNYVLADGSAD
jgi:hypothetical protein